MACAQERTVLMEPATQEDNVPLSMEERHQEVAPAELEFAALVPMQNMVKFL